MKMDFRGGLIVAWATFAFLLSGCGQGQTNSTGFQALTAGCTGAAMPQQYIVRHLDNSIEVVHAENEAAFLSGYIKQNEDKIKYAEHDFHVQASNKMQLVMQLKTSNNTTSNADNWGVQKIAADKLWQQNVRGSDVIVAIIDTGMDLSHPQLASQAYTNPGETGTDAQGKSKQTNGIDDDSNGYIDDYQGYDFVAKQPLKGDNQYHGTHVAGIIAAAHNDTVAQAASYVQGVAPAAKVLPLAFLDSNGAGSISDGVLALQYAVQQGAQVINASWGGSDCSQSLQDEIASLAEKNVVFVNASGNDGLNIDLSPEYPAALNLLSQITVGAIGDHDSMADYSNYGPKAVHIFAPGTNITSTLPGGLMGFLSGTSMATPFVAGAIALLRGAVPKATVAQIRSALYSSAVRNSSYLNASQGRLDLAQAVTQLQQIVSQKK